MKIEIDYNGATAVCKVDGKYLHQCDSLTRARVFSAFSTIKSHIHRERKETPKSQSKSNEYKIGDCIVYDCHDSDGIMIIGSFDFGNGANISAARALFGEHHLKSYNSTTRYSGYAPGISEARLATEEEKKEFFSNKEMKEYLLMFLNDRDYLKQYVEYL